MWAWAIWPWAAEAPEPSAVNGTLITVVGTIIVAVIGVVGGVIVQALRGKDDRPEVVVSANGNGSGKTNERVAVLERRQDDTDDELDILDRQIDGYGRRMERHEDRLKNLERWLDDNEPGWRHGR